MIHRSPSSSPVRPWAVVVLLIGTAAVAPAQTPPSGMQASWAGFIENRGQWDGAALYRGAFGPVTLWAQKDGFTVAVEERTGPGDGPIRHQGGEPLPVETVRGVVVRMKFEGSGAATAKTVDPTAARHNWFLGNDPAKWVTDVRGWREVRLAAMYRGVDVILREQDRHCEYDLVVAPDGRLDDVVMTFSGQDAIAIDGHGDLVLETQYGVLRHTAPVSWEIGDDGARIPVASAWRLLEGGRAGFTASRVDPRRPLVVDPGILWSNLIGGIDEENPGLGAIAVSANGNVNVAGVVLSTTFPTTVGAYQTTLAGPGTWDGWVARLSPAGTLLWSTYLGGAAFEAFRGLAIAPGDKVTVVGASSSFNFPMVNAFDSTFAGAGSFGWGDAVVVTLDPAQTGAAQLVWSTFCGGFADERLNSVTVDAAGIVTAAGWTYSPNIPGVPLPSPYQGLFGGIQDGIIARFNPALAGTAQLTWFTFFGGSSYDYIAAIAPRAGGTFAVTGATFSPNFPVANAYQPTYSNGWDATLSVLNPALTGAPQLVHSTFLGGSSNDYGNALAVDKTGVLVMGGYTQSANYPTTPGAYDTTYNSGVDAIVSRLDPTLAPAAQLLASTYVGGSVDENVNGLALDASGGVHAVGAVSSANFPTTPGAYQTLFQGGGPDGWGPFDAFAFILSPTLASLNYSTFIGGTVAYDFAYNVALDACGNAYVSGLTRSSDFPASSGAYAALDDVFLLKADLLPTGVSRYGTPTAGCNGPLEISARSNPQSGNAAFAITCAGAPPLASGLLGVSAAPLVPPLVASGLSVWVNPGIPAFVMFPATSSNLGYSVVPLPVPMGLAGLTGYAQFAWADSCAPGGVSGSCALMVTVQ